MTSEFAPWPRAAHAVVRCVMRSAVMLVRGQVQLRRDWVGREIRFADGSTGRVYRETAADESPSDPCVLLVFFRLRGIRGAGHKLFEWESLLNTPLFIGFPGFGTKLWIAHDANGVYRGLYEWDGAPLADAYARSLWRFLQLVSEPGSIHYQVLPGMRREAVLEGTGAGVAAGQWWRVVEVSPAPGPGRGRGWRGRGRPAWLPRARLTR